jgi:hypothetical protein
MALRKKKKNSWQQYMQTGDYLDYVRAARDMDSLIGNTRKLCREFEQDLSRNIKSDPKAFWWHTNSKLKTGPKLDLEQEDGTLTKDDTKKAQLLNNFFASVFTRENTDGMPILTQRHTGVPLAHIEITPGIVEKKLKKLKPTKSAGPDGLHPRVLLETASAISLPLSIVFTKSLAEERLPEIWKTGHITPIHKKGKKTVPGNYRPVSLTSVVGKVMESLVGDKLVQHMIDGQHFCDAQHGFVPGRSCMTQLLVTLELWTAWLDMGEPLEVVYLVFKKAFDSIPHSRLLEKLKAYGIDGNLLHWISHFLRGRRQRVIVTGKMSVWVTVHFCSSS